MCRSSSGSEIYDLAWSPDGMYFISGSMDNVARIYSATNGMRAALGSRSICLTGAHRDLRQANRRAQSLRPGSCLGPSERIRCNPVLRSVCPHIHPENERWAVLAGPAQQGHQDGPASTADIVQQSGASRLRQHGQSSGCFSSGCLACRRIARHLRSGDTTVAGHSDESSTDIAQSTVLIQLPIRHFHAAVCLTQPVDAVASRDAIRVAELVRSRRRRWRWRAKHESLRQRDVHVIFPPIDLHSGRQPLVHPCRPVQDQQSLGARRKPQRGRGHQHCLHLHQRRAEQAASRPPAWPQKALDCSQVLPSLLQPPCGDFGDQRDHD